MSGKSKPKPVVFTADLSSAGVPLKQPWQWCVGSGHATLALRADWQEQLTRAHRDLGFRHVRFHGILDDDMGTLICEDDEPVYSFFNTDRIFDFLLSIGMKPVVELSFMPRMLSSGGNIVFHYQGNITPPKDYSRWAELIRRLATHWIERYGIDEVAQWPFECWNEPNLKAFWLEDQATYFKLYQATAEALKTVDRRLQVGGPVTADNEWLDDFNAFCTKNDVAADFMSTHYYPTDTFGTKDTDTVSQLADCPPDEMRIQALEARTAAGKRPLYYTEWSITSNPRDPFHDSSFAAALATRIVMSVDDVVDGYSYWTFSDIFEENYFPSIPYHGGFGMMNLYGVPKPIYRALQMLRKLGDEQIHVAGEHANVAVWAGRDTKNCEHASDVVLINQAMPRHAIQDEVVRLQLSHAPKLKVQCVTVARVDENHANPEKAWKAMGSPTYPKPEQVEALVAASHAIHESIAFVAGDGMLTVELSMAPQSVSHLHIEWTTSKDA